MYLIGESICNHCCNQRCVFYFILGTEKHSRFEYRSLEGTYANSYELQIEFKTLARDGVIFYSTDLNKRDLIALYIKEGRVRENFLR